MKSKCHDHLNASDVFAELQESLQSEEMRSKSSVPNDDMIIVIFCVREREMMHNLSVIENVIVNAK